MATQHTPERIAAEKGMHQFQVLAAAKQEGRLFNDPLRAVAPVLVSPALAAKLKLDWLMEALAQRLPELNITIMKAPLKGRERAEEKIYVPKSGRVGDWGELKDYARTTLVLPDNSPMDSPNWLKLTSTIRQIFSPRYGFQLPKDDAKDGKKTGYTDHNFVFQFGQYHFMIKNVMDNHFLGTPMPPMSESVRTAQYASCFAEVQINNINMMYAKMSKDTFDEYFPGQYAEYKRKTNVDGAEGHLFYEVIRKVGEISPEGQRLSKISKDYYERCRGLNPTPPFPESDPLLLELTALKRANPPKPHEPHEQPPVYSYTEEQI
ncbi:MAG: hypothetical protein V4505_27760 [Pseudomonadota bacterium]